MKVIKYNLFITLFLFICIHVCAQVEQNPLYLKNYAPSPEAYSMMQQLENGNMGAAEDMIALL